MTNIRTRLEAHAAACREALAKGNDRHALPEDLLYLSGSDLSWSDLRGADLSGANLRGAELSGADLRWANLSGTRVRVWFSDRYCAYTVPSDNGQLLAFGCERHTLDVWERDVAALCKKDEPDHAERYEAEIRALIALCRVIEKEPKP